MCRRLEVFKIFNIPESDGEVLHEVVLGREDDALCTID